MYGLLQDIPHDFKHNLHAYNAHNKIFQYYGPIFNPFKHIACMMN